MFEVWFWDEHQVCDYCLLGSVPQPWIHLIIFFKLFRILALEKLGAVFNQVSTPVQYTPRKLVFHVESKNLIMIETDHNAYTEETKETRKKQMAKVEQFFICDLKIN